MEAEQVTENTQSSYDELYDKGFDDGLTEVDSIEEEEILEQPEDDSEPETDTHTDEDEQETEDGEELEDSVDTSEEDTHTIQYKGQDMNLTKAELVELAQKGFDYTTKTQDLSSKRRFIELAEEYDIDEEILANIGESKKGNKEAFATLANKFGIDPYELDSEADFKPVIEQKNYELDDAINEIKADTEHSGTVDNWINMLPPKVGNEFAMNPNILRGLHTDTRSGLAQKVMPEVIKTLALNPNADFLETYQSIGSQVVSETKEVKPEASRETKKKMAVSKKKVSSHTTDHQDVWSDDDLYKKMQQMRRQ